MSVTVELLPDLDAIDCDQWRQLLCRSDTDVVFLTQEWLATWWRCYGSGRQLLLAAARDRGGDLIAIAPLFADDDGMVYFIGSGGCGSDYLDFIGDVSREDVLASMLDAVRAHVNRFAGFRFYFVPGRSRTWSCLRVAAVRTALAFADEGQMAAPTLDLTVAGAAERAINKRSLVRHERYFERDARLVVHDACRADDILPHLDDFFAQHVERWKATPYPSLFGSESHRDFYRRLVVRASATGWLRFMQIRWRERPIAMHFGFCYKSRFLWYKPTFAIDLARHSPGEVLIRHLLLAAANENAVAFDFGIGDEAFKQRFATATPVVRTCGLLVPDRRSEMAGHTQDHDSCPAH